MTGPFSRVIDAVASIATKVGAVVGNTGNRLADNLEGIANAQIGGVPSVAAADKGKYLHANSNTGALEWAAAGGSGGGVLVVNVDETGTLNKTWQEIHDAFISAGPVVITGDGSEYMVVDALGVDEGKYMVADSSRLYTFVANTASGYPELGALE